MSSSIHLQLVAVIVAIIALMLAQSYIARENQAILNDGISSAAKSVIDVGLVKELERDVIDLQRNVLIFRESASKSAITRFTRLMVKINAKLDALAVLKTEGINTDDTHILTRMREHLIAYQDNFNQVVRARAKRDNLVANETLSDVTTLETSLRKAMARGDITENALGEALSFLLRAENAMLKYLAKPDMSYISIFNHAIDALQTLPLYQNGPISKETQQLTTKAKSNFFKLTQITQGNLFLVNVVMAGSANEFLFLSGELANHVTTHSEANTTRTYELAKKTQQNGELFSFVAILLALSAALFATLRILGPIRSITEVFNKLSQGAQISIIPGSTRNDEIGNLAKAALVFSDKNQQTKKLLREAQSMNTQLECLNKALTDSKLKAEQATASKSMFLANMSHEIRTPMNGIIGLIELAQQQDVNPTVKGYLDKAAYSGQILLSVINDILDFSKIEAGKLTIEEVSFSLHSLFDNLIAVIALRAKEKNLAVHFTVDPVIPPQVIGDPLRIAQIIMNIGNNAVKFTDQGNIDIEFSGTLNAEGNSLLMTMRIVDTGIGMSEQQLKEIFTPFTQADGSTNRKYGGTGLGLTIVRQLTELMDGALHVTSTLGKGSKFDVTLPLKTFKNQQGLLAQLPQLPSETLYLTTSALLPESYCKLINITHNAKLSIEQARQLSSLPHYIIVDIPEFSTFRQHIAWLNQLIAQEKSVGLVIESADSALHAKYSSLWKGPLITHPFTPAQFEHFINDIICKSTESDTHAHEDDATAQAVEGHILLVEDNDINQLVTGEVLTNLGLTFDIAEDGRQAVQKMGNTPQYDLILMDVQMPVMDGFEATKYLRDKGFTDVPIIGLSANAMKDDKQRAIDAGMDDYLTKPIKQKAIVTMLAQHLLKQNNH